MNPEAMTDTTVEVTLQERLAEIDNMIKGYDEMIAYGEALTRLEANPDFQKVVSIGYFDAEADRITGLIVGDDPLRREAMENIIEAALGIRNFKQFLKYKKMDAAQAVYQIEENLAFRNAVTQEYANEAYLDAEVE